MTSSPKVAIVGIRSRLPKAYRVSDFWDNLKNSRNGISRFTLKDHQAPSQLVGAKGILKNSLHFNHVLFGYSKEEASFLDPQERILLQQCHQLLAEQNSIENHDDFITGVYTSSATSPWLELLPYLASSLSASENQHLFHLNNQNLVGARIAQKLNVNGPSASIGSGCSSGLTTLSYAVKELLTYQCDYALCGSAKIQLPEKSPYPSGFGDIWSPTGTNHILDEHTTGTIPGDGAITLALMRLEDAEKHDIPIYGSITSFASGNITTTNKQKWLPDQDLLTKLLTQLFYLTPDDCPTLDYCEVSANGILASDQIEIMAWNNAFGATFPKQPYPYIGTAKGSVGNIGGVSGLVGLAKILGSFQEGMLFNEISVNTPHPLLQLNDLRARIQCKGALSTTLKNRCAALLSYNQFGGATALMVEWSSEWKRPAPQTSPPHPSADDVHCAPSYFTEHLASIENSSHKATLRNTHIVRKDDGQFEEYQTRYSDIKDNGTGLKPLFRDIISDLLGAPEEPHSFEQNLFKVGLSSFLMVRFIAIIEKITGTKLPLEAVANCHTIEKIHQLFHENRVLGSRVSLSPPTQVIAEPLCQEAELATLVQWLEQNIDSTLEYVDSLIDRSSRKLRSWKVILDTWQNDYHILVLRAQNNDKRSEEIIGIEVLTKKIALPVVGQNQITTIPHLWESQIWLPKRHRNHYDLGNMDYSRCTENSGYSAVAQAGIFLALSTENKTGAYFWDWVCQQVAITPYELNQLKEIQTPILSHLPANGLKQIAKNFDDFFYENISGYQLKNIWHNNIQEDKFDILSNLVAPHLKAPLRNILNLERMGKTEFLGYTLRWLEPVFSLRLST
ncbi:MAG: beta-ketoacyl synthase N-terminal-like domain-containing protein [Myxococcota bacterium]|nr:beta-ketoacyl synthase N-terminal-like domain-containing protein [Myxococcota bacterium]